MDPFRSERLVYRAFDSPEDDQFFDSIQRDPIAFANSCPSLHKPLDHRFTENIRKFLVENSLLFVVICLASSKKQESAPSEDAQKDKDESDNLEPIGTLFLKSSSPDMAHHRCSEFGIDIVRRYQGQAYGTEAITWMLDWAFGTAGLHRVELAVLGWNEQAHKLYERVGFREEGRKKRNLWKSGRWWDEIFMGIVEDEWTIK